MNDRVVLSHGCCYSVLPFLWPTRSLHFWALIILCFYTVKDRKNMRTIKTGRPNKFLLQKINKGWTGLELGQHKRKKALLERHFTSRTGPKNLLHERDREGSIYTPWPGRRKPVEDRHERTAVSLGITTCVPHSRREEISRVSNKQHQECDARKGALRILQASVFRIILERWNDIRRPLVLGFFHFTQI